MRRMRRRRWFTLTVPSYTVPIPLWGSMPSGPLVCSGGTGHTAGALSAHVTWQEKLHTAGRERERGRESERPMDAMEISLSRSQENICWIRFFSRLTFTGAALADEPHHEGGAAVALGRRVEGLHHKLMCFRLQGGNVLRLSATTKQIVCVCKCGEKKCNLRRGTSDAAVASGAHGGGLDWAGWVVYQLHHTNTHTYTTQWPGSGLVADQQQHHCSLLSAAPAPDSGL